MSSRVNLNLSYALLTAAVVLVHYHGIMTIMSSVISHLPLSSNCQTLCGVQNVQGFAHVLTHKDTYDVDRQFPMF